MTDLNLFSQNENAGSENVKNYDKDHDFELMTLSLSAREAQKNIKSEGASLSNNHYSDGLDLQSNQFD